MKKAGEVCRMICGGADEMMTRASDVRLMASVRLMKPSAALAGSFVSAILPVSRRPTDARGTDEGEC